MASNRNAAARRFHSTNGLTKFLGQRSLLNGLRRGTQPEAPPAQDAKVSEVREALSEPEPASGTTVPQQGANGSDHAAEERPNPFASTSGGLLALAGPRSAFHVDKRPSGEFVLRHIDSGRTTTVCGIDYIRFADLTVHREFLVRSNPGTLVDPTDDTVSLLEPAETVAGPIDSEPADPSEDTVITLEPAQTVAEIIEPAPTDPPDDEMIDQEPEKPVADSVEPEAADLPDEAMAAPESRPSSTALTDPSPGEDDDGFAVNDDGSLTITAAHFVAASDEDKPLRVVALSSPSRGRIIDNGDATWTFTPDEAFDGEASFDVILVDEEGEKSLASATIAIETAVPVTADKTLDPVQEAPSQPASPKPVPLSVTADFVKPLTAALAGPAGNALTIDLGAEARDLPLARSSISATGEFVTPLVADARVVPPPAAPEKEPAPKSDSNALVSELAPEPDPAEAEPSKPEPSKPEPAKPVPAKPVPDDEDRRLRELVDRLLERADDILAGDTKRPVPKPDAVIARPEGGSDPRARPESVRLPKDPGEQPPATQPQPPRSDKPTKTSSPSKTSYRQVATFESFESFDW